MKDRKKSPKGEADMRGQNKRGLEKEPMATGGLHPEK